MLDGILASLSVAEDVTLIVPLGLLLCTLGWLGWALHRRDRAR
jgi:hypothetical protein